MWRSARPRRSVIAGSSAATAAGAGVRRPAVGVAPGPARSGRTRPTTAPGRRRSAPRTRPPRASRVAGDPLAARALGGDRDRRAAGRRRGRSGRRRTPTAKIGAPVSIAIRAGPIGSGAGDAEERHLDARRRRCRGRRRSRSARRPGARPGARGARPAARRSGRRAGPRVRSNQPWSGGSSTVSIGATNVRPERCARYSAGQLDRAEVGRRRRSPGRRRRPRSTASGVSIDDPPLEDVAASGSGRAGSRGSSGRRGGTRARTSRSSARGSSGGGADPRRALPARVEHGRRPGRGCAGPARREPARAGTRPSRRPRPARRRRARAAGRRPTTGRAAPTTRAAGQRPARGRAPAPAPRRRCPDAPRPRVRSRRRAARRLDGRRRGVGTVGDRRPAVVGRRGAAVACRRVPRRRRPASARRAPRARPPPRRSAATSA